MLSPEDNALLTQTDAVTPMGRLFRRYWVPALLTEEVPAPDCPPVKVRLLGEDLVAFRDTSGRVGLLGEHCAHRGTSLFYGRNEECGLRCIYHGWKYDVEGNVLDTPAEPAGSTFAQRLRHTAYPTTEVGGMVFAYLGPRERTPPFPEYEWTSIPTEQTYVTKCLLECNYLQGLEGESDNAHLEYLHRTAPNREALIGWAPDNPDWDTEETDFGVRYVAVRPREGGRTDVRVKSFVLPASAFLGVNLANKGEGYEVHTYIPADDHTTWRFDFGFRRFMPDAPRPVHRRKQIGPDYRRVRTMRNHYLQDRELQRTVDFTGIEDFLNEDSCATETMGPIVDRAREHLGMSDRAVIAIRRYLLDTVQAFQAGDTLDSFVTDPAHNSFRHADALHAEIDGADWRAAFPHLTLRRP
ncbi:MAG: Phthalate 4,5-dioxygenase [Chloroflexi bacterium]|nr:Phthalate 4,5-dioxygenase [Chloroflexota bacterium]